jgi:outer membrane lipoprotein SlyB
MSSLRHHILALTLAATFPALALADACKPDCGKVENVSKHTQEGKGTGLGAVAGGVVGGLLGNQVGQGRGRTAATVVGVAGGAYAGHQIEKKTKSTDVYVVTVRMDNGQTTNYEYESSPGFAVGDRVQIVSGKPQRYTGK